MLDFASSVESCEAPDEVLNKLDDVVNKFLPLRVLGAVQFPLRWGDWNAIEKGKTAFIHESAPAGWWEEQIDLAKRYPGPAYALAQISMAPFTMSQLMRMLEPLGIDRWPFELAHRYGMRDRYNCPVGGRWVVSFWSSKPLNTTFSDEARAIVFMGATFAAIRLQKIVHVSIGRRERTVSLTPRELAVLRLVSLGYSSREMAHYLRLGEETVRTHLKKAQEKLGVHDRAHAVAQALRRQFIS